MVAETENAIWVKSNRNLFRVIRHACNFFLLVLIFNPNIFDLSDRQQMLLGILWTLKMLLFNPRGIEFLTYK